MQQIWIVFATVFLAEIGDKTQLAALLFASDRDTHPLAVFLAASAALVAATGVAVLAGAAAQRYLDAVPLELIAGLGFLAIGAFTLWRHFVG